MARTTDTRTTTTSTTPPTTTRSAGSTRPPGAPRSAPVGRPSSGAWAWIVGLVIAFAVIWFIWWWWTGQDVDAEAEITTLGAAREVGMIVPAVERGYGFGSAPASEPERLVLVA